ncbi:hypothetical protein KY312_03495, partial [Candidatus Woesearchaeota archaeon]|nr:hypothetical protein [Candidatus Woesearchaeota archaeon]
QQVCYELVGLPQEIKKKERYITNSPEKAVVELLAQNTNGLTREQITKLTDIASPKLTSIFSDKKNESYISLWYHELVKKNNDKFILIEDKNKTLEKLYKIKREQNKRNNEYIKNQLRIRQLYPLNQEKSLISARIIGHLFTDGCLSLKTKQLFFSGKEEDLKEIKKDINILGFNGLGNINYKKWKNGECWSFGAYKISLLSLFYSLGAPVGKKTDNYFLIPKWIMEGNREVKKQFLASFFGGEGTKPKFQGRTVKPIVISQTKRTDLKQNLKEYLQQVKNLLFDFNIESSIKIYDKIKSIRKDGTKTVEGKIWVRNSRKNIIKFLEEIGYAYCRYKGVAAEKALQDLKWKESLGKKVYSFKPVPYFDEWQNKHLMGDSCYFYITDIKKIEDPEYVYCLATENQKFIANDIVVHNCDALTKEAQQALRRTMENYTQTCRFILSCNFSSKIIDPIKSRCTLFKFKPLSKQELIKIIDRIAKEEKLQIDEKAKDALFEASDGDCRRAENILQGCAALSKKIDETAVFNLASTARPKEVLQMLELAVKGDFVRARDMLLKTMLNYGLSGLDIIRQIQKETWELKIDDRAKLGMIDACGEAEFRMVEGSDEFIQLEALLAKFAVLKQ